LQGLKTAKIYGYAASQINFWWKWEYQTSLWWKIHKYMV